MNTKLVRSHYRLLTKVLALALVLGALALSPPAAVGNAGWTCEDGCWAWDSQNGCTQPVTCCASTRGAWFCVGG